MSLEILKQIDRWFSQPISKYHLIIGLLVPLVIVGIGLLLLALTLSEVIVKELIEIQTSSLELSCDQIYQALVDEEYPAFTTTSLNRAWIVNNCG